jgi:hypothetical protein
MSGTPEIQNNMTQNFSYGINVYDVNNIIIIMMTMFFV